MRLHPAAERPPRGLTRRGGPDKRRALAADEAGKKVLDFLVLLLDEAVSEGVEAAPLGPNRRKRKLPGKLTGEAG